MRLLRLIRRIEIVSRTRCIALPLGGVVHRRFGTAPNNALDKVPDTYVGVLFRESTYRARRSRGAIGAVETTPL
jgi:hypothetical protein